MSLSHCSTWCSCCTHSWPHHRPQKRAWLHSFASALEPVCPSTFGTRSIVEMPVEAARMPASRHTSSKRKLTADTAGREVLSANLSLTRGTGRLHGAEPLDSAAHTLDPPDCLTRSERTMDQGHGVPIRVFPKTCIRTSTDSGLPERHSAQWIGHVPSHRTSTHATPLIQTLRDSPKSQNTASSRPRPS